MLSGEGGLTPAVTGRFFAYMSFFVPGADLTLLICLLSKLLDIVFAELLTIGLRFGFYGSANCIFGATTGTRRFYSSCGALMCFGSGAGFDFKMISYLAVEPFNQDLMNPDSMEFVLFYDFPVSSTH